MTLDKSEGFALLLFFNYVYLGGGWEGVGSMCVLVQELGEARGTGTPGARELELQEVVSCLIWTLGTELRSSCRSPLSHLSNSRISSTLPASMALLQRTGCPPASSGHTAEATSGCVFVLTTATNQKLMGVVPRKMLQLPSSY